MKHKPFIETARRIATELWGTDFDTDSDASKHLVDKIDASGACLLYFVRKFDQVLKALTDEEVNKRVQSVASETNETLKAFIAERVAEHGECPEIVRSYYETRTSELIGRRVRMGCLHSVDWPPGPPCKGTEARKEYDAWMKKRVKKAKKAPDAT